MKKLLIVVMALLLLTSAAFADISYPLGEGQIGFDAVVISKNISLRPTQNANARAIKRMNFGDHLIVRSLGNGWCEVYLSEMDGVSGYVLEDYILIDPAYITTEESTPVYAWQARNAKRVGLLGTGETYPIIRTDGNWLLISLRGAAGWIVRPDGDSTGTAWMKTADVLQIAQSYLLSTDPWAGNTRVTAETLRNYYSFAEFNGETREWLVTFDSGNGYRFEVLVDDATGNPLEYEPANG